MPSPFAVHLAGQSGRAVAARHQHEVVFAGRQRAGAGGADSTAGGGDDGDGPVGHEVLPWWIGPNSGERTTGQRGRAYAGPSVAAAIELNAPIGTFDIER